MSNKTDGKHKYRFDGMNDLDTSMKRIKIDSTSNDNMSSTNSTSLTNSASSTNNSTSSTTTMPSTDNTSSTNNMPSTVSKRGGISSTIILPITRQTLKRLCRSDNMTESAKRPKPNHTTRPPIDIPINNIHRHNFTKSESDFLTETISIIAEFLKDSYPHSVFAMEPLREYVSHSILSNVDHDISSTNNDNNSHIYG